MKKAIIYSLLLSLIFMLVCTVNAAYAKDYRGHKEQPHGGSKYESMVFHKAHLILENEKELGLTDEQVMKIKKIKIDTKKALIKQKAEIELIGVDIKEQLWSDKIDVAVITPLVNKKYELKKAKSLSIITALAQLKDVLTAEQKEKMKTLCKKHKEMPKKK